MASGAKAKLSSNLLNLWFNGGGAAFPSPTIWIGWCTVTGTATAASETEASGGNYGRTSVTVSNATAFPVIGATVQIITNNITIGTVAMTAALGAITGIVIYDALAAGNGILFGDLSAMKTLGVNDIIQFLAANLSIQLT
jgi:hypothetical protein